jgi:hypothetical protein
VLGQLLHPEALALVGGVPDGAAVPVPLRLLASSPYRLLSAAGEHAAIEAGAFWEAAAQRRGLMAEYYESYRATGLS